MPKSRSLMLIVPEVGPALSQAIASGAACWPHLARLAGRGSVACMPAPRDGRYGDLQAWQRALLEALGLQGAPELYPSAAVIRAGDLGQRDAGFWMHASPMHFVAGLDHLAAQTLQGDSRVGPAEATELEQALATHLRGAGYELARTSAGDWLVRSEHTLDMRTMTTEAAVSQPLAEVMPQGRDAAQLRRLMTELQMVLHEHPANAQRLQRGLAQVNAIWLHGVGAVEGVGRPVTLPQAFGDNLYLRGIYRLNDCEVMAAPADAGAALLRCRAAAVGVIGIDDLDTLEALWLAPLASALARGRLARLDLVLGRWRITIERMRLLQFWRAALAPAQWRRC